MRKAPKSRPHELNGNEQGVNSAKEFHQYAVDKVAIYKANIKEKVSYLIDLGLKEESVERQIRMLLMDGLKAEKQVQGTKIIYNYPEFGLVLKTPEEIALYESVRASLL